MKPKPKVKKVKKPARPKPSKTARKKSMSTKPHNTTHKTPRAENHIEKPEPVAPKTPAEPPPNARNKALEEAAVLVETYPPSSHLGHIPSQGVLAAAIRTLKS